MLAVQSVDTDGDPSDLRLGRGARRTPSRASPPPQALTEQLQFEYTVSDGVSRVDGDRDRRARAAARQAPAAGRARRRVRPCAPATSSRCRCSTTTTTPMPRRSTCVPELADTASRRRPGLRQRGHRALPGARASPACTSWPTESPTTSSRPRRATRALHRGRRPDAEANRDPLPHAAHLPHLRGHRGEDRRAARRHRPRRRLRRARRHRDAAVPRPHRRAHEHVHQLRGLRRLGGHRHLHLRGRRHRSARRPPAPSASASSRGRACAAAERRRRRRSR